MLLALPCANGAGNRCEEDQDGRRGRAQLRRDGQRLVGPPPPSSPTRSKGWDAERYVPQPYSARTNLWHGISSAGVKTEGQGVVTPSR